MPGFFKWVLATPLIDPLSQLAFYWLSYPLSPQSQVSLFALIDLCSHLQIIQSNSEGPEPMRPTLRLNPLHFFFIRASLDPPHPNSILATGRFFWGWNGPDLSQSTDSKQMEKKEKKTKLSFPRLAIIWNNQLLISRLVKT